MNNNDVLRRLRYAFNFDNIAMLKVFQMGGKIVSREQISGWLKKEDDPTFLALDDEALATGLNGLVILQRGRLEGPMPVAETQLNNNIVLRKLKIATAMRDDEILAMLTTVGLELGKHELSALFRKPDHKHYRECKDQVLRNFLKGLGAKLRKSDVEIEERVVVAKKPKAKPAYPAPAQSGAKDAPKPYGKSQQPKPKSNPRPDAEAAKPQGKTRFEWKKTER